MIHQAERQIVSQSEGQQGDAGPIVAAVAPKRWTELAGSAWKCRMTLEGFKEERKDVRAVDVVCEIALMPVEEDGRGQVRVQGDNKFITKGFVWSVGLGLDDNSEDDAVYLRLNVRGEGLEPTVPDGSLYLNAKLTRDEKDGAIVLSDGLVTFKRPQKARFLFAVYDGLLAEFKVVGNVVMEPIPVLPE
mmetsp:Transcript_26255/g.69988  ORF Transcript_26255/g.69988 Transcript_26255/m.69988 type:complete len:189 (+) Transcript_26255:381-947(+)